MKTKVRRGRLLCLLCGVLGAQPLQAQQDSIPLGSRAFEIETRDRWMHGGEKAEFTAFREGRRGVYRDSLPSPSARPRTLAVHFPAFSGSIASVRLRVGPAGRVTATEVAWPIPQRRPNQTAADSADLARLMLRGAGYDDERISLPEERLWGMVPPLPPSGVRAGLRWTDTIDLSAERDGFRQALSGERISTVAGDTVVAGRRLWIVHDTARVRYDERSQEQERTLDTLVTIDRSTAGTIVGTHLLDSATGFFELRSDTTRLAGEATLRYPDGREFSTPARYERSRRWTLYDSAAYAARIATLQAERDAGYGGMVLIPDSPLERRLAAGDPLLQDSLLTAWQNTSDPDERERLLRLLDYWNDQSPDADGKVLRTRWIAGDTAGVIREIASGALYGSSRHFGVDTIRMILPFMADPGLAFAFGLDRDTFYETLGQGLLWKPPAIMPDTGEWACTLEACRLLAEQWESAREPRLRDVGLIAHLVLAPARWSDTVLARAAAGSTLLEPAVQVVRGVGATWISASKMPLPEPEAGWRAWLEWMNGTDPGYVSPTGEPPSGGVRWERSHEIGLRFYAARTGRDVVDEMRRAFQSASSDSARLVYGTVLLGVGEHRPDPRSVAARLQSERPAAFELARREFHALFDAPSAADPTAQVSVINDLLSAVLSGSEPWQLVSPRVRHRGFGPILHTNAERPVFLVADSLPYAVRERWADRVKLISTPEMQARSDRLPGVYFFPSSVERAGPFARVNIDYSERQARGLEETPIGYAGGLTVYLLESGGRWLLAGVEQWVT